MTGRARQTMAALVALLGGALAWFSSLPPWARGSQLGADRPQSQVPPPGSSPEPSSQEVSRRRFLTGLSIGLGAIGTAIVSVPVVGFVIGPLLRSQPDVWRQVGPVGMFKVGDTVEVTFQDPSPVPWAGVTADSAAWLRRVSESEFRAFSIHCTHLGCPIRWLPDAHLFMCPCHGGVFYQDGRPAAGPPPVPLAELMVRVREGQVEVRTRGVAITGGVLNPPPEKNGP